MDTAGKRLEREQRVIEQMIGIYCRGQKHERSSAGFSADNNPASAKTDACDSASLGLPAQSASGDAALPDKLCPQCRELAIYTRQRNASCPRLASRSFCQFCPVHCYKPQMRERIARVMRYAGPRMLWHNPAYALKHLRELRKQRKLAE